MKLLKKTSLLFLHSVSYFLIIFLLQAASSTTGHAQQGYKQLKTIVLDAGHGGKDIGTPHFNLSKDEKDIALDIVLKLGKILNDSMPQLKVIYTRTTDVFVPLQERHEIANKANADLFISVHVNSTAPKVNRIPTGHRYVGRGRHRHRVQTYRTETIRQTDANGTETLVLGLHRDSQKSKAIKDYGDNVTEEPGMLDENDPTTQIIIAQYTQTFLSRSIDLASLIQQNFEKQGRNSYGVKQRGLEVLAGSAMPAVLVETGFINNPTDEIYLNSDTGQTQIAMAIYKGIKAYQAELNKKATLTTSNNK